MNPSEQRKQLSDLQLAIMRVLWERDEATVAEVQEILRPERRLALTTVSTLLTRLERARLIAHRTEGRTYIYRPLVSRDDVRRSMLRHLVDSLFGGNSSMLVSHLLREQEIDPDELT